jgi:parallel beta-helix repeat protein
VLVIGAGTYGENIDAVPSGSSWENATTLRAAAGDGVILKPGSGARAIFLGNGAQYIIIDGLIVDGENTGSQSIRIGGEREDPAPAKHIKIMNGEVRNSNVGSACISVEQNTTDIILSNLRIYNCQGNDAFADSPGRHGIYWRADGGIVENCRFSNFSGYGIQFYDSKGGPINNNIIRNNTINNANNKGGIVLGGSANNNSIYNNIIYDVKHGMKIGGSSNKIYNNTIYEASGDGISLDGGKNIVKNNIIYANAGAAVRDGGSGNTKMTNLTTNPLFVDAANRNFSLQSKSPAIDAGETINDVPRDFAGVLRPQGEGYDIGAYEFKGSGSSSPSPVPPTNLRVLDMRQ